MIPQHSVVWRADIAVRTALRGSAAQESALAQASARAGNWWGGPGIIWFGAVIWLGARAMHRRTISRIGLRGLEALAVASAASGIAKGVAGRARPFVGGEPWHWEFNHGWTDARFFSMPSGHTTATAAFAVAVLLATTSWPAPRRAAISLPLLLGAALVAWARLFTDQHWLSDVAVGIFLGVVSAILLARLHVNRKVSAYDRVMLGADEPHTPQKQPT